MSQFLTDIATIKMKENDYVKLMNLLIDLLEQNQKLCSNLCEKSYNASAECKQCTVLMSSGTEYAIEKFSAVNTIYKRTKKLKRDEFFVEPAEKAIGLRWKTKKNPETEIPNHRLEQSTFQYAPILS